MKTKMHSWLKKSTVVKNNLFYILILSLLFSCGKGNTMQSSGKAGKLYEVFYVKNGVTQYFIKPLKLKSDDAKFSIDFTLRSNLTKEGKFTCNFSTLSKEPIKKIETVYLSDGSSKTPLLDLEKVFLEKQGTDYQLRYTSNILFEDFSKLTKSKFTSIIVNDMEFEISKKVQKKWTKIDENVVEIIELNFED